MLFPYETQHVTYAVWTVSLGPPLTVSHNNVDPMLLTLHFVSVIIVYEILC